MLDYSSLTMLPRSTSYYGHDIVSIPCKIEYTDRSNPKMQKLLITFTERRFNHKTGLIEEYPYFIAKGWVGDNEHIHLSVPLPNETVYSVDMSFTFCITPEQEDIDEVNRQLILVQQKVL